MSEQTAQDLLTAHLNRSQRQAVLHGEGPLLVLAGAGSGKTRVITYRIINLIRTRKIPAYHILGVTFTNKAAKEMGERIQAALTGAEQPPLITTFHALGARILRQEGHLLGYTAAFVIYDESDSERVLKDVIKSLDLDEKRFSVKVLAQHIDHYKNRGEFPEDVTPSDSWTQTVLTVYQRYQERLMKSNALDFGDLLLQTIRLFTQFPDVLAQWQQRFQWLLVDEYQDTNPVQYTLIKLLAGERRNLCVVGDDDQSIYSWRGADIRNILEFEFDFPGVVIIRLEQNYRSTGTILKAASAVVAHNRGRKDKALWTENRQGDLVTNRCLLDDRDEARFVVSEIQRLLITGQSLGEIAVFYRTNAQSRLVEDVLTHARIPYVIIGGVRFYSRQEIKDVLAFCRVVMNPDDEVSLKRIINVPPRGIGPTTVAKAQEISQRDRLSLYQAFQWLCQNGTLSATVRSKVQAFIQMIEALRELNQSLPADSMLIDILHRTGYQEQLEQRSHEPEVADRLENIDQLLWAVREFLGQNPDAGLPQFLEQVTLATDTGQQETEQGKVTLMTLHSAKGLEFRTVFIIGFEETLLPHARSFSDRDGMEEERRLCYVGITRAQEHLYLLHASRRHVFGQEHANMPSRFLREIPRELLDTGGASQERHPNSHQRIRGEEQELIINQDQRKQEGHNLSSVHAACDMEYVQEPDDDNRQLMIGARVRHPSFGVGTVRRIEGSGFDQKVLVWFSSVGPKKLMVRYAGLTWA